MIKEHYTERYATGKYMVYAHEGGKYPYRIGHICGGKTTWLAERGRETVGYFDTVKKAAEAIADDGN